MREKGRLYYTLHAERTVNSFTDNSGVGDVIVLDVAADGSDDMFLIVNNRVYTITSHTSGSCVCNLVRTPDEDEVPGQNDRVFIVSNTDYIDGFVDRGWSVEHAYYSRHRIPYNSKTTKTVSFSDEQFYKFVKSGTETLGSLGTIETIISNGTLVFGDCAGTFAYKGVWNGNAETLARNGAVKRELKIRIVG
jgi:hypothetical protein